MDVERLLSRSAKRCRISASRSAACSRCSGEFELLRCLLAMPGEVVSKEHPSARALGRRLMPYKRSIDTHISNLRGKRESGGSIGPVTRGLRVVISLPAA